jgi:elongation factor 3
MVRNENVFPLTSTQNLGELLEKSTRVMTSEEQAVLDQDWVGRDGTKRKMEVGFLMPTIKYAF